MKQPIDYFNHACLGRENFFDLPTNEYLIPAQYCITSNFDLDGVNYKNVFPAINGYVAGTSIRLEKYPSYYINGLSTQEHISNPAKLPNNIQNFRYNIRTSDSNQIVLSDNNIRFNFEQINVSRQTNRYIGALNRVMIKAKRLKDVFEKSKVLTSIKTVSGKTYTYDEFISLYGNKLVPVNEDGEYIDTTYPALFDDNLEPIYSGTKGTRPYIAIPVDSNNTPLYPLTPWNLSGYNSHYFLGGYSSTIIGDDEYQASNGAQTYIPFSVINKDNIFPYLSVFYDHEQYHGMWHQFAKIAGSNVYRGVYEGQTEGQYYVYDYNTVYEILPEERVKEVYVDFTRRNKQGVNDTDSKVFRLEDNGLYYESDLSLFDRCFWFNYNNPNEQNWMCDNQTLLYCMFDKDELENYFGAFGVEVVYMFDLGKDFVQGQKVRHASLINQPATNTFTKQRHESLINQQPTSVVKKVRHIL